MIKLKNNNYDSEEVQKLLHELYIQGEEVVIAWAPGDVVEFPLFTEEGEVYDTEKSNLSVLQYCKIKTFSGGVVDDGHLPENINIKDLPNDVYSVVPIHEGEYGDKNKKHVEKKVALHKKWLNSLKWVKHDEEATKKLVADLMKKIFGE